MIHQMNIYGKDKVEQSIERIRTFEPEEGYYLAFSGGKDSVVIKRLAEMAGVKFDAHYTVTSCDPPELVRFVKSHKDVKLDFPRYKSGEDEGKVATMWNLIPKRLMPPTRMARYCCAQLKEAQGDGRFVMTGVRWAESKKRSTRGGVEISRYKKHSVHVENVDPDNPSQETVHFCMQHSKRILNPIIDWSTDDVWEFIREYKVPYCSLYDEGFKRLGCIGCPVSKRKKRMKEFERWPKYRRLYGLAFERMIKRREETGRENEIDDPEKFLEYWMGSL